MTMEWITGVKLTTLPPDEIRDLVGVGQEAFLVQLLEVGFFHGDPHPGNLLKVRDCRPVVFNDLGLTWAQHSRLLGCTSCCFCR